MTAEGSIVERVDELCPGCSGAVTLEADGATAQVECLCGSGLVLV